LLGRVGQAWAAEAGGTSGVLWGAALEAFGRELGDDATEIGAADIAAASGAFARAIQQLGGASRGDKTLLDALLPFVDELEARVSAGDDLATAWGQAATVAGREAEATASLRLNVGRARPLAEKSLGHPDA